MKRPTRRFNNKYKDVNPTWIVSLAQLQRTPIYADVQNSNNARENREEENQ